MAGELEDITFIDLQLSRLGNPIIDLMYFIFTSTTPFVRKQHLTEWLQIYYNTFFADLKTLKTAGLISDVEIYSYEDMLKDWNLGITYGVCFGIMHCQVNLNNGMGICF